MAKTWVCLRCQNTHFEDFRTDNNPGKWKVFATCGRCGSRIMFTKYGSKMIGKVVRAEA